ncbi:C2H2 domain-containing protein [Lophiostoma macrostomum CBS 122681]|uniref:C2H2 domain-containing protein n=1 Tax=Lophiostoma macrostomum CBS 122681 TaxID=1314788 RepID=A0A6A6TG36_9PLEO|nr:C2H2 domain-containing protein [Lophiostoma macrostomum CBS 122681]
MAKYTRTPTEKGTLASNESTIFEGQTNARTQQRTAVVPSSGGEHTILPLASPFRIALTNFRNRLSGTQLQEFQAASYDQLCQDIVRLQHQQETEKKMRNMSRLSSFLEAMNQFSKVIEVYLNVSDAVAFVWGPIKFLLMTASAHLDAWDKLLDAYDQIGENLPLLSEYESIFRNDPHMLQALVLMYTDILDFHQRAMRFFIGKRWNKIFRALWNDFETRFGGILRSLRRHKELIESRANLIHYRRYQEDIAELKHSLDHSRQQGEIADSKHSLEEERNNKARAVKEWLATGSQSKLDHEKHMEVRQNYQTTGLWILKHEYIIDWMDADVPVTPLVWMNGIPGAGKTILASIIIEECKRRTEYLTSYFYCNYDGPGSNNMVGVMRGILEQLVDQYPDLMPYCHNRKATSGEPALSSANTAKKILEDFCITIPKQFIIIDGLDECEIAERKQIMEFLISMITLCDNDEPGKLRVLVVSQDYGDIKKTLHSTVNTRIVPRIIPLTSSDNETDIRIFVNDWAGRIKAKHDLDDDQTEYLKHLTVRRAQGMFLYANLVLPNLYKQPTRAQLVAEIQERRFPNGLEEAYERIISRIKQTTIREEWEKAKKLLGWMVCAKRQLTWKEIQIALSMDCVNQSIEYDDRRLRTHIYDICGSLVQVSGDRVSLVHSTAKLYITTCTKDIHAPSVECELAALCLQYLTFQCFDSDQDVDKRELRQLTLEGHLAFQDYAIAKWFHHINALVDAGNDLLNEGPNATADLAELSTALDDFTTRYQDEKWYDALVPDCEEKCKVFEGYMFYDHLVAVTSHIYTFQKKGFDARHVVSIKSLSTALERNRKLLETLPDKLSNPDLATFQQFYDTERRYKCPKITCMYFSEGFRDAKSRKKHVNIHDRPFQCEVPECLATECGFANSKDLEKHTRAFHPEKSDLAESFKPASAPRAKTNWACSICGKTFTRNFHRLDHEKSHRGERPHECPECGKAFTRLNDCKRHQKLHDRR